MASELEPTIVVGAMYVDMALFALALAGVFRAKIRLWRRGAVSVAVGPSKLHPVEMEFQAQPAKPAVSACLDRIPDIMIKLDRIEAKIDRFANQVV